MRIYGGVKTVVMGGRPTSDPMQAVGGSKGAQALSYDYIAKFATLAVESATTQAQVDTLTPYTSVSRRILGGSLNVRDHILPDNVEDGLPAQYVYEAADCRLYLIAPMLSDVTKVWKAAADAAWSGAPCVAGVGIPVREER